MEGTPVTFTKAFGVDYIWTDLETLELHDTEMNDKDFTNFLGRHSSALLRVRIVNSRLCMAHWVDVARFIEGDPEFVGFKLDGFIGGLSDSFYKEDTLGMICDYVLGKCGNLPVSTYS